MAARLAAALAVAALAASAEATQPDDDVEWYGLSHVAWVFRTER